MSKKLFYVLTTLVIGSMLLGACTTQTPEPTEVMTEEATEAMTTEEATEEMTEETTESIITKVALVTDVGTIDDESFNQATWQGVESWCTANGIEYTYYQPTEDSTDARVISITQAITDDLALPGCEIIPQVVVVLAVVGLWHQQRHILPQHLVELIAE